MSYDLHRSCFCLFVFRVLPQLWGDVHGNGQHPRHPEQLPGPEDCLQSDPRSRKVSRYIWPFSLSGSAFICASLSLPPPVLMASPHRKATPHRDGNSATVQSRSCCAGQLSVCTQRQRICVLCVSVCSGVYMCVFTNCVCLLVCLHRTLCLYCVCLYVQYIG